MTAHVNSNLAVAAVGMVGEVFVPRRAEGGLSGEIAGVVGLFSAIGSGALLHALRIVIISAITATPCCLEYQSRVSG